MDTKTALSHLREYLRVHGGEMGIRAIGIFGSVATGRAGADSDVDIVVELDAPRYAFLARIKTDLEGIFGRPVDVVRKRDGMNPLLRRCIEEDAVYA